MHRPPLPRPFRAPAAAAALAVFLVASASRAAADEPPRPESIAATRIYKAASLPDGEVFQVMLEDAGGKHVAILGVPSSMVPQALSSKFDGFKLKLQVDLRPVMTAGHMPKLRAAEFLEATAKSLAERLETWQSTEHRLAEHEQRAAQARAEYEKRRAQIRDLEEAVRKITGRSDASLTKIGAALPALEEKRETLRLEVLGKQARQDALAASINELAKAAAERVQADAVAAELQKVVEARTGSLERLERLFETGQVPEAEVADAKAKLAEARARMLERRDAVQQNNGGELLGGLNRELATLSIDIAEGRARLAAVEEMIKKQVEAREVLERGDELPREKALYERLWQAAEVELRNARDNVPGAVLELLVAQSFTPDDPRYNNSALGVPDGVAP